MVGVVYSNRARGEFIDDETRLAGDLAAERVGLEAVRYLAQIDSWKAQNQKEYYVPQLSGSV
jgi:hypothetical protein